MEVETQATIARVLGYIKEEQENEILHKTAELGRILNGLVHSLTDDNHTASTGL